MLFAGEEWGAKQPFLFFSDAGEDLADIVREGREKEMETFPRKPEQGAVPDPMAEETFRACKLDWADHDQGEHARFLALYYKLIAIRKQEINPRLPGMLGNAGRYELLGNRALRVSWTLGVGSDLSMVANLSSEPFSGINLWGSDHLWLEGFATGDTLEAWSVIFNLKKPV